jgi:microcompartment protein CcmL/EutN
MLEQAIGFIETDSIAGGIVAADACVKRAAVELLEARPICPGKFMVLIRGDMSQVRNALQAGTEIAGNALVDQLFLPRVHPGIFEALAMTSMPVAGEALGVIETVTAATCIVAADAAAKRANVNLLEIRLADGLGGKSYVIMEGTVADVEAAVGAGVEKAVEAGLLVRHEVITRLHPAVRERVV